MRRELCRAGYPLDAEGLLIVELDGPEVEVDYLVARVEEIARGRGATTVRVAGTSRSGCCSGRPQGGVPAVGQITPDYMCLDGSVPRGRLVEVLGDDVADEQDLRPARGERVRRRRRQPPSADPVDANDPDELRRAEEFGAESCASARGSAAC